MSVADKILRFFADKELTKESASTENGNALIRNEDLVLMPGQTAREKIFLKFSPFKPNHFYEIESVVAFGDARVVGSEKKTLKAGESIAIDLLWTGRVMSIETLEPLSAEVSILGRLVARPR